MSILLRAMSYMSSFDSGIQPKFYCVDTKVIYPEPKMPEVKVTTISSTKVNHESIYTSTPPGLYIFISCAKTNLRFLLNTSFVHIIQVGYLSICTFIADFS